MGDARGAALASRRDVLASSKQWTKDFTKFEVLEKLNEIDVPCGPILSTKDLIEDESLAARGMIVDVRHPERGTFKTVGCPLVLSDTPVEITSSPLLGEHNEEILKEIGWDGKDAARAPCRRRAVGERRDMLLERQTVDQAAVRAVLDRVKAEKRSALSAPEAKAGRGRVRLARSAGRARDVRRRGGARWPRRWASRSCSRSSRPTSCTRPRPAACWSASRTRRPCARGYDTIVANAKKYTPSAHDQRRAGAADAADRRAGSDRRRRHRPELRQAGRVRSGRRAGRGAQGRHVPARAGDARGRALDARRHPSRRDAQGRARRASRSTARRSRRSSSASRSWSPTSRRSARSTSTRCSRRPKGATAVDVRILVDFDPPEPRYRPVARRDRARDEPHHAARLGRRDRRVERRRQDRQLGDEEPHQRRLQGEDLSDQPQSRRDPRLQGVRVGQGHPGRRRRRGVRDPGEVRRRRADRVRREADPGRRADPVGLRRDRQRRRPARDPARSGASTTSA